MFKYHVQVDCEPGFDIDMEEPVNTGDYIYKIGHFLIVRSKTFFIDEKEKVTAVLLAEYHDEEEYEDEDEDGVDDTSFVPDDGLDSFCVPHD